MVGEGEEPEFEKDETVGEGEESFTEAVSLPRVALEAVSVGVESRPAASTLVAPETAPVLTPTPEPSGPPIDVVVYLPPAPNRDGLARFKEWLIAHPGQNSVTLSIEGMADVSIKNTSSLSPAHSGEVAVFLPGASVHQSAASIDLSSLAAGLEL